MSLLLLIVLILLVFGGLPTWGYHSYGWGPSGLGGVLLIIVLGPLLTGRLGSSGSPEGGETATESRGAESKTPFFGLDDDEGARSPVPLQRAFRHGASRVCARTGLSAHMASRAVGHRKLPASHVGDHSRVPSVPVPSFVSGEPGLPVRSWP